MEGSPYCRKVREVLSELALRVRRAQSPQGEARSARSSSGAAARCRSPTSSIPIGDASCTSRRHRAPISRGIRSRT
jgi:hypothetical protein